MANYLVLTHDDDVIAVGADYDRNAFVGYACAVANRLEETVKVYAVRLRVRRELIALGSKFSEADPIVDQDWQVDPLPREER